MAGLGFFKFKAKIIDQTENFSNFIDTKHGEEY
jgi:hypothetical protein